MLGPCIEREVRCYKRYSRYFNVSWEQGEKICTGSVRRGKASDGRAGISIASLTKERKDEEVGGSLFGAKDDVLR
jgi:hypothetical protein